jgi:hypothetical protein
VSRVKRVFGILGVLWAGSLWSVLWVTFVLFHDQPDRHLAGLLAGRLFTIETALGVGVAALALVLPGRSRFLWGYLAAALLALNEWGLRPIMAQARLHGSSFGLGFGAWHGVSTLLYGLACLAVVVLVWNDDLR